MTEPRALKAIDASRISIYGTTMPFEKIVKRKTEEVERQIRFKLELSSQEKLLALLVPPDQNELYEEVKSHFNKLGYNCFYVSKDRVSELRENKYLFISWDLI